MAEHSTVNRRVAGSSPAWGVFYCKTKAGFMPVFVLLGKSLFENQPTQRGFGESPADLRTDDAADMVEQTLQEFDFGELIGLCFKYILIFLVGIC